MSVASAVSLAAKEALGHALHSAVTPSTPPPPSGAGPPSFSVFLAWTFLTRRDQLFCGMSLSLGLAAVSTWRDPGCSRLPSTAGELPAPSQRVLSGGHESAGHLDHWVQGVAANP